jgi:hypothetical protein
MSGQKDVRGSYSYHDGNLTVRSDSGIETTYRGRDAERVADKLGIKVWNAIGQGTFRLAEGLWNKLSRGGFR